MRNLPASVWAHLRTHHGVINTEELHTAGVSVWATRQLVSNGVLIPIHQSVYRFASAPPTIEARCAAACSANHAVVIGGPSAAALWEFPKTGRVDRVFALCPHDSTPIGDGVTLRRSNILPATDIVQRPDGIRVTSVPRTWFDRARDMTDDHFESLTEYVIDRHVGVDVLWRTAGRLRARGRPGSRRVGDVLGRREVWQKPAGSDLERRVLVALEQRGVKLVRQFELVLPNGWLIRLDGADPVRKFGVEVDHVTWHGGRFDAQRDKARDRQARRMGWTVERITDQECRDDFERAIDELVEMYALASSPTSPLPRIS